MSDLEVLIENGVATLVMNRPEARNALSMDMRKQLAEKLHEIELDPQIRCVVLKGAGDHFMAGGDVKGMGESIKKSPQEIRKEFMLRIHDLHPIMFAMRRMPKPIIASCRGAAAGAGVSMALGFYYWNCSNHTNTLLALDEKHDGWKKTVPAYCMTELRL